MKAAPPEPMPDVVTGCLEACRRCEAVVAAVIEQDPTAYPAVGPHLRHCVDHFRLLAERWRSGTVDYDARAREQRLERDPQAVLDALDDIAAALRSIRSHDLPCELTVMQSAAPGRPPVASSSRLERELIFLSGHTIHHIAIMVFAAKSAGVVLPSELAVAYSTEAHRETYAVKG